MQQREKSKRTRRTNLGNKSRDGYLVREEKKGEKKARA